MSQQLKLDEPFPATPQEREAAIALAFGPQAPARIVRMRAARVPCLTTCGEPIGRTCSQPGPPGTERRLTRQSPHPGRVALTVTCKEHKAAPGCPCPGEQAVCDVRREQVTEEVQILAVEAVERSRAAGVHSEATGGD